MLKSVKDIMAEWQHLRKDKLLLLSLVVISFIPIMYGGFFLGSIWDPYGNTKNLPVAVVNNDVSANVNNQTINIGKDVVNNLKSNHDMGWKFVTESEADSGIKSGKYYMELKIPVDFSKNVATITQGTPEKGTIYYTLTPSRNYIASLLTNQAAEKIKTTVSEQITKSYVSAVFDSLANLKTASGEMLNGASSLRTGLAELKDGFGLYAAGEVSITDGLSAVYIGANSLNDAIKQLNTSLPSSDELSQLNGGIESINNGLGLLKKSVDTTDPVIASDQADLLTKAQALTVALTKYQTDVASAGSGIYNIKTTITGKDNSETVSINVGDINGLLAVFADSNSVASGSSELLSSFLKFSGDLVIQQTKLSSAVASLYSGYNQLLPGLFGVVSGMGEVASVTSQLSVGATSVSNGVGAVVTGNSQIAGGLKGLSDNSGKLTAGLSSAYSGSQAIEDAMRQLGSRVSLQPTGENTINQVASPVTLNEKQIGNVPNYGYALAPYVLSLGLYVGTFVFSVIYPVRRSFIKNKNAIGWWASKAAVAFAVAICQALVLDAIMIWCLGLHPDNLNNFILLSMLTSVAYMSIILFLSMSLDNIGRFIAMLILVLQLGSAEGVFPLILSPKFFQFINPYMPMTYSIRAFRQTISSGLGHLTYINNCLVLLVIAIVVNISLILFLTHRKGKDFSHQTIEG